MLRTCNQLLRRLSKANDVVFCGRIIMFLAHFFPLSERSAVNIKGVFNVSNETNTISKHQTEFLSTSTFTKPFGVCRSTLATLLPLVLLPSGISSRLLGGILSVVLNTFEAQPLSDEESSANNLEDEAATFSIKYLTSSNLMGLELKDPSFRRHILVQCLILFDYLKAPGKNDKDLPSETMKDEIKSCEERVKQLLVLTPPKGEKFLRSIEHILERERNWVWWKRDGCGPFEKQPTEKKIVRDGGKKRRPRWRLGNKELAQLWKWAEQNPDALTDPKRVRTPAVREHWKKLADDMDPEAGIEAEYSHKNNRVYCWKGLRFSARQDLEGFSRFTDHGVEGVVPWNSCRPMSELNIKANQTTSQNVLKRKKQKQLRIKQKRTRLQRVRLMVKATDRILICQQRRWTLLMLQAFHRKNSKNKP
ncbi:putative THO complex, subunit THOC1 protein [Helianthus annuus]|nr:putative THO complex, subunit THOC1 protein [Helianthus annuus]